MRMSAADRDADIVLEHLIESEPRNVVPIPMRLIKAPGEMDRLIFGKSIFSLHVAVRRSMMTATNFMGGRLA